MKRTQSFRAYAIVFGVVLAVTSVLPVGALASDQDSEDPLLLTDGVAAPSKATISRESTPPSTAEIAPGRRIATRGEVDTLDGDEVADDEDGDPIASSEEGDPTASYVDCQQPSPHPNNVGGKWTVTLNANNPFLYPQCPAPQFCRYCAPRRCVNGAPCTLPIAGNFSGPGLLNAPNQVRITITCCSCPAHTTCVITGVGNCYYFSTLCLQPSWTGNSRITLVPIRNGTADANPCHTVTIKINLK
jgi:hypothetical protein